MKVSARFRLAVVAAVAVVGLTLAGCSGAAEEPSDPGSTDDTLRLSLGSPPSSFAVGTLSGNDSILTLSIFDNLVITSVDGQIVPGLAESWETSEDGMEVTFHLRGGQVFSDGSPVDADAVVASLEAARVGPSTAALLASVSSVTAADEGTVVVTLAQPDAALVGVLSTYAGAIGSTASLTSADAQLTPVGSGAYTLDEDATTVGSVYVLNKNDDHWNAEEYPFETIEFSVIPDATAVQNALQSGQLDYAGVSSEAVAAQFDSANFTTGTNIPGTVSALWLVDREGAVVPALADVRVRQAINMAIDREGIAAALNPGTNNPTNQVYNPQREAFSEELLDTYAYDVEAAKQLMADAGYEDGFDVTLPSTVVSTPYESVLTQSLGDIGVRLTWEAVPFQEFFSKVLGLNYGMFFMMKGMNPSDASDTNSVLTGTFNPFQSMTPELDELLAEANAISEDDGAAFRPVNEYLVDEAWFAPVSTIGGFYVHSNAIEYTPPVLPQISVRPFAPAAD